MNAAQANFEQAQTELTRYRRLYETRVTSQAELDRRQNTYNTAKARLDSAQSQLRVAQNQMDYTELHADADGVITSISVEAGQVVSRSEEHTSELQSLMRISYAVFCLKKKKTNSTSY